MRFPGNVVTRHDTRQDGAGVPTKCFYCNGVPDGPHDADCACIHRPVKIKLTIEMVVPIPRHWTKDNAEFYWNDSSSCKDNLVRHIERYSESDQRCLCPVAEVEFLGEATLDEAVAAGLIPDSEQK